MRSVVVTNLKISNEARTYGRSLNPLKFMQGEAKTPSVIAMSAETTSVIERCVYYTDAELSFHVLTYQQRQDFALVLVIRRHCDVFAFLPAEGNTAAVRAPDRCSQSKNFPDIRKTIERKTGVSPEEANYAN